VAELQPAIPFRRRAGAAATPLRLVVASALVLLALAGTGCVEREIWIVTDPPGVKVYLDGEEMEGGTEPLVDDPSEPDLMRPAAGNHLGVLRIPFDRFATREVVLTRDGYATQTHHINPDTPFWEHFPFDFFTEVLLPSTIHLRYVFRFTLEEQEPARADATWRDASRARQEAGGKLEDARERYDIK
jgi:hypothetical protein